MAAYSAEPQLATAEFARVLTESGLGALRPIGDETRLATMLASADLAWPMLSGIIAKRRAGAIQLFVVKCQ